MSDEVERHRVDSRARDAAPVVSALRQRVESLRREELERRRQKRSSLSDAQWDEVDAATRAVVAKLLHDPTVALKEASGTPRGERLVEALPRCSTSDLRPGSLMAPPARHLRLASRGSPLARWQAERVAARLAATGVDCSVVVLETEGDRRSATPIEEMGGRGVFVREVQRSVTRGDADAAVHSAKDLPASAELSAPGLTIAAIPERADPRDLLVGSTLEGLPTGSTVATGSTRRRAQLANLRPDLVFNGLRGNMDRRLARAGTDGVMAVVVAKAATDRLGWSPPAGMATEALPPPVMVPQVAQGALAVECRSDDREVLAALAAIDDPNSRPLVEAERAFLAELGGGCTLPVGAHAHWFDDAPVADSSIRTLCLTGMMAAYDGRIVLRRVAEGDDPAGVGHEVAGWLLDAGGRQLLGVTE